MKALSLGVGLALAGIILSSAALAQPTAILVVGNSYTFGRLDPVMGYNTANVEDMTRPRPDLPGGPFTDTSGTNPFEPHPWGGVPGIFKQLTDEAGLDYAVSLSTRNAATLRGHFLNTANPTNWNLRGNIAAKKWDVVVLQEQSDAPLPAGRGANANLPQFGAYVDKIENYIHVGTAQSYRERMMYTAIYGSVDACVAAGGTNSSCNNNSLRTAPANPNFNAAAKVYVWQTWARPDMVFPHLATVADDNSPDGAPIVDTTDPNFPNGFPDTLYYDSLAAMAAVLHTSFANKVAANPNLAGVVPVGDAFQRAIDGGIATSDGFYDTSGVYSDPAPGDRLNLWWLDYLHASKYGSYLSALVLFGTITGIDPWSFGASEQAASDLGISPGDAVRLQKVASAQLIAARVPLKRVPCLHANPGAAGKACEK
jgi:hypothetical protein